MIDSQLFSIHLRSTRVDGLAKVGIANGCGGDKIDRSSEEQLKVVSEIDVAIGQSHGVVSAKGHDKIQVARGLTPRVSSPGPKQFES